MIFNPLCNFLKIAVAQSKLDERSAAATLLRYILETPPGLKGTEWETRYQELLKKCDAAAAAP